MKGIKNVGEGILRTQPCAITAASGWRGKCLTTRNELDQSEKFKELEAKEEQFKEIEKTKAFSLLAKFQAVQTTVIHRVERQAKP
ncbi:hypothetical protein [Novipirellula rosea]|uniref:Uncharacterized protein n=1 Tax=Novipirellula rosea TaxID=1031540 RepID=A0ABP8MTU8_9BACT